MATKVNFKQYLQMVIELILLLQKINLLSSLDTHNKTEKARAAIRRYWHNKDEEKQEIAKKYNTLYGFHYLINQAN